MEVKINKLVARQSQDPKIIDIYQIKKVFSQGNLLCPQVYIELKLIQEIDRTKAGPSSYMWRGMGHQLGLRDTIKVTPEDLANNFRELTSAESVLFLNV